MLNIEVINIKLLKKHKGKIFILIFIIFTLFIVFDTYTYESEDEIVMETVTEEVEEEEVNEVVIVDVKGEVNNPNVYELTSDNTVMDAINAAGGLTSQSDTSNLNLSKKLEDEMVIIVYSKTEIAEMKAQEEVTCPVCNDACLTSDDEKAKLETESDSSSESVSGKVNINTADSETLQTLDGIGEAKAEAIIEYREENGDFETIEDIKNVSGIGDSIYEKIKDYITV